MYNVVGMYGTKKGFTLIEFMVVLALMGIFATLGIANYQGSQKYGRDGRRQADLEVIRSALELYRSDNGGYPLTTAGLAPTYISAVPQNPKPVQDYAYAPTGCVGVKCTAYTLTVTLEKTGVVYTVKNP